MIAGADAGDVACRRALARRGREIGLAVAAVCNVLNPRRIVIGGELAPAWPHLEASFPAALDRAAMHVAAAAAEVVSAPSGRAPRRSARSPWCCATATVSLSR